MGQPYPQWFNELVAKHKEEGLKAGEMLAVEPQIFKRFMDHISKRVKHDVPTKNLVFLTGLSAYTPNPINLFLRGESSIGKSYNATKTLQYFPSEDVWMLGGLSRTALIHSYGILVDENDNEIDLSEKPNTRKPKKRKNQSEEEYQQEVKLWEDARKEWHERMKQARYIVDLHNKILVFLEAPHYETFAMLRPILSHDAEEISYRFTDKRGGELKTVHVVLRGWPATVFNSTKEEYVEDLATRSFTITPETGFEKLKAAVRHTGEMKALPWKFREGPEFVLLQGYLRFLKNTLHDLTVANPMARELAEHYPADVPRRMRDFDHVTSLMEVSALFHYCQRPIIEVGEGKTVLVTMDDFEVVLDLLPRIEETTITGLSGHILDIFHKVVEPLHEEQGPFDYRRLAEKHNEVFRKKRAASTLRKHVELLCDIGYVDTEPHPTDKRKVLIRVIKNGENPLDSVINGFSSSYTLESLKSWFSDLKKCVPENIVVLREKIYDEHEISLEGIYEKFCHRTLAFPRTDFPDAKNQAETVESQTEHENALITENPVFPKPMTGQEIKPILTEDNLEKIWPHLPKQFEDGVFQQVAMEKVGLMREAADQLWERLKAEEKFMRVNGGKFWSLVR